MTINLPYNYTPRPYQLSILKALDNGVKRAVWVVHRRGGKDVTILNWVIKELATSTKTCFYVFPSYAQAKKAIWDAINSDGFRIIDYIPPQIIAQKNAQEMKVRFKNGSLLQLIGSDNIDSIVGTNPSIIVFSEYALQDPSAWDYLRPILKVNKGIAIFISTPRGRNHFWDMFRLASANEEWFCELLTVEDTDVLTQEDIEQERKENMSEELIQQEYYCFPKGQYVHTHEGVKCISQVKANDLVLTHTGRWRRVLDTIERDYEGELIQIKSFGSSEDIYCTSNHPIRIYERHSQKYRWKEAQHIQVKDRLCFPKMNFSCKTFIDANLAKIIAWYITEGSTSKNHIQFSVANIKEADKLKNIIDEYFDEEIAVISKLLTHYVVIINDCALADFLKIQCGVDSYNKKIPLHLISGHEKTVLLELIEGDGCISKHKEYEQYIFCTTSKTLAYQVQLIANSVGYTAGISVKSSTEYCIENRKGIAQESYNVRIGSVKIIEESTKLIRSKYNVAACVRETSSKYYKGKVYNLKVQYDESYTINGRSVHNCSFDRGVEGSYYAKLLLKMEQQGRVTELFYDEYKVVHTAWDLGWDDSTAIIFFQVDAGSVKIIDYEEHNNKTLAQMKSILSSKPYRYGYNLFPHDVEQIDGLSTGCTRKEILEDLQIPVTTVKRSLIADGIESVKALMSSRLMISKRCDKLLKAIENYHKDYDAKNKVYSNKPRHDWSSHACDALRYMAEGLSLINAVQGSIENDYKALRNFWGS